MSSKPELQRRLAELSAEIRAYPTPIARCDEQLGKLLEDRREVLLMIENLAQQGPCSPAALWLNDGGSHAA
jgi:hypothetical protein